MEKNIGENLKKLRIERNLSQYQLAEKLFVNRSSVANWESGRRIPDLILLSRIASIFNVDINMLTETAVLPADSYEVIVIDDEKILLAGAIPILAEVMPNATITGFTKVSEALEYSRNNNVLITFLDIELGRTNGLEVCEKLLEINPKMNVIFLTSYPDYAVKAWQTLASGFLLKPLHAEDVRTQLLKLRHPIGGLF